jgi:hypothetical protein
VKEYGAAENGAERMAEQCQHMCRELPGAVHFTLESGGKKCICHGETGVKRYNQKGASSGPVNCKDSASSIKLADEELEENLNETTMVPMEQIEPCRAKSGAVSNVGQLEEKHMSWVEECLDDAAKIAVEDYNIFYKRFAVFADMLAWKAGCGGDYQHDWSSNAKDGDGMVRVSDEFDGGRFGDCNWDREEQLDKNIKWVYNEEKARGWTKTSRVNMNEQAKMKTPYPMPSWLRDLRNVHDCLKKTAGGNTADINSGISTGVAEAMGPAAIDPDSVQTNDDPEFDRLLQDALRV